MRNVDVRARLTPDEQRQLAEADHAIVQIQALKRNGQINKGIPPALRALQIRQRILGTENPETATCCNMLAYIYASSGTYAKAEPLYRQSLEIRMRVLGENHPDTATSLNNLGGLYKSIGNYAKAEILARQALEIRKFYKNLWQKKLGKLDALRQAQLRMLREYDPQLRTFASRGLDISSDQAIGPKRGSPFYWAAFVLSGHWR